MSGHSTGCFACDPFSMLRLRALSLLRQVIPTITKDDVRLAVMSEDGLPTELLMWINPRSLIDAGDLKSLVATVAQVGGVPGILVIDTLKDGLVEPGAGMYAGWRFMSWRVAVT